MTTRPRHRVLSRSCSRISKAPPDDGKPIPAVSGTGTHAGASWSVGFAQAMLQRVELILDAGRQLLADELEPLLDLRQLFTPLRDVDCKRGIDIGRVDIQTLEVEI